MPRRERHANEEGPLGRVASAVKRLLGRGRSETDQSEANPSSQAVPRQQSARPAGAQARPPRRETDVPQDVLDHSYSPPMTSSKASFRSDGADHQRGQEFAFTAGDGRWNDEDHYTNKSGDPRIGTRRRTYEPGEDRAESRD